MPRYQRKRTWRALIIQEGFLKTQKVERLAVFRASLMEGISIIHDRLCRADEMSRYVVLGQCMKIRSDCFWRFVVPKDDVMNGSIINRLFMDMSYSQNSGNFTK